MLQILGAIAGIVLVDLALSGDNALVIGAAAAYLPRRQRLLAIIFGGVGAVVLRIAFAIAATLLLELPLLQAIGGAILLVIAIRLLAEREPPRNKDQKQGGKEEKQEKQRGFLGAVLTILIADVTMSLDNVISVGALAHGEILYLMIGILLSIIILMFGSALVAELMGRLPWLLDIAALVLAWTGGHMLLEDIRLGPILEQQPWTEFVIPAVTIGIVLAADIILRLRDNHRAHIGKNA